MVVIEEEAGPDMFWGLVLDEGKTYTQKVQASFRITMAAIEPRSGSNDVTSVYLKKYKEDFLLCTLKQGSLFQQQLDLGLITGEYVGLFTRGKGTVHLTGHMVSEVLDNELSDDDSMDSLDEEEDEEIVSMEPVAKKPRQQKAITAGGTGDAKPVKSAEFEKLVFESDSDDDDYDEDEDDDESEDDSEDEIADNFLDDMAEDDSEGDDSDEDDSDDSDDSEEMSEEEVKRISEQIRQKMMKEESAKKGKKEANGSVGTKTPNKDSKSSPKVTEKKGKTPQQKSNTPQQSSKTPQQKSKAPQQPGKTPQQAGKTPQQVGKAPQHSGKTPQQSGKTPQQSGETPQQSSKAKTPQQAKEPVKTPKQAQQTKTPQKRKLPSGVTLEELKEGHGPEAKSNKMVHVYYTGKLTSGKVFDSTTSGKPFKFRLGKNEVIKGWELGLQGMKVGGKRRLTIPPNLAYGNSTSSGLPPNSTLHFDVELKAIS